MGFSRLMMSHSPWRTSKDCTHYRKDRMSRPVADVSTRNEFTSESVRKSFIMKVYFILTCQLAVVLVFTFLVLFIKGVKEWIKSHVYVVYAAMAVALVVLIAMACCRDLRRNPPMNYIFLAIFTTAEGFTLGAVACYKAPTVVMMSIGITAVVCLALTLFALQTKWDFTTMGGILICSTVVMLLLGVIWFFMRTNFLHYLYAGAAALVFSMYLVYDTQLMMRGKLYSIHPDEYTYAALNLYLDVVQIYLVIANMFKSE